MRAYEFERRQYVIAGIALAIVLIYIIRLAFLQLASNDYEEIAKNNACVKAGLAGDRLTKGLESLIKDYKLPYVAYNQGSICHLECSGAMSFDFSSMNILNVVKALSKKSMMMVRKECMEQMGAAYMANGIVTLAGSRLYTWGHLYQALRPLHYGSHIHRKHSKTGRSTGPFSHAYLPG